MMGQPHDFQKLYNTATTLLVQFKEDQAAAFDTLVQLGQDSVYAETTLTFLVDQFDTKSAIERHRLKDIFKKIGESAIPNIVVRIGYRGKDAEDRHLKQSLWILGEIGGDSIVEPVSRFIEDNHWQVRSSAYTALGKSKSTKAHEFILLGLIDTIAPVRKSAYYALSQIAGQGDIEYLVKGLGDEFYGVRYAALKGLVTLDSIVIEPLLTCALRDDNQQFFAVHGLCKLGSLTDTSTSFLLTGAPEIRLLVYEVCEDVAELESYLENEGEEVLRTYLQRKIIMLYNEVNQQL